MSLIVVEAIRGRCASFMILTATVSEIFGGWTNSSFLVVGPILTLLMSVYSLGACAIDGSYPLDPALRHGDNFLPGVPHILHFRLHVSPGGVSWPACFPLPFGIPCQVLSGDARWRFSQRVTNPTQFSSFYLYFYWQLISLSP